MHEGARVGVLIPAYNEARQIEAVIAGLPAIVDDVVVVDDASTDDTVAVVERRARHDPRVTLLRNDRNLGVGGALARAYKWARDNGVDVAVSIDGDGQMDPDELADLISPVVDGTADYAKGNRLSDMTQWRKIPRVRLYGNAVLSLLTKATSGYWQVADSQSGYTAAGRYALEHIDWDQVYPRYGRPNDVLILANIANCRVVDVPTKAIYGVGEQSSMKIAKVTFTIAFLLVRRFWYRLFIKYVLRDFHPLVFFYLLAVVTAAASLALGVRLVVSTIANGQVPQMTALALSFLSITSLNSVFFAMWMDMQANEHLSVRTGGGRVVEDRVTAPAMTRRSRDR